MAEMRLVVAGAGGRMGRTLVKAIADSKEFALAGALEDARSPLIGWDAGILAGLPQNGIKLTGDASQVWIEIGVQKGSGETIYHVADHGAGFDMAYASRLFGAFQRLHTPSEFEGTGIGLALVQKIVTGHGGRIWVEARPEQGATFYFTLP